MSFLFLRLPLLLPDSSFYVKNRNHKILFIKKHNNYITIVLLQKAITKGINKILKTCNCKYLCSFTQRSCYSLIYEYFRVFIQLHTHPVIAAYIVLSRISVSMIFLFTVQLSSRVSCNHYVAKTDLCLTDFKY